MANLAEQIRRHFLWLLLGVYVLATIVPGPGKLIARFDLAEALGVGGQATAPLMMVALLLFLAALAVDLGDLRVLLNRPGVWLAGLAGVWLGPALAVLVAGWIVPGLTSGAAVGLLLGMTLIAAMPVANSSVAWTQQSGGALPWSLGLVVLSILLTPWVTPLLLQLSGWSLSGDEAAALEHFVRAFSGVPFIVWVVMPTAAGFAVRRLAGAKKIAALAPARQLASAAVLLVLNYANGSIALPKFFEHPSAMVLAIAAAAALTLAMVGVSLASLIAGLFHLDHPTRDALRYALSMKHTGLASAILLSIDHTESVAMLLIVVATPTQHLVAALIDRLASSRAEELSESRIQDAG